MASRAFSEIRVDYIGSNSVHRTSFGHQHEPYEARLRVAAKVSSQAKAEQVGEPGNTCTK
ncbi:hypothetical protein [Brevibacillus choshinensis]|uniref:hypothetical protein n=1 Tax=Brevibacillus choshinensis TaxID=54911 RepID=UPI003D22D63F